MVFTKLRITVHTCKGLVTNYGEGEGGYKMGGGACEV